MEVIEDEQLELETIEEETKKVDIIKDSRPLRTCGNW